MRVSANSMDARIGRYEKIKLEIGKGCRDVRMRRNTDVSRHAMRPRCCFYFDGRYRLSYDWPDYLQPTISLSTNLVEGLGSRHDAPQNELNADLRMTSTPYLNQR